MTKLTTDASPVTTALAADSRLVALVLAGEAGSLAQKIYEYMNGPMEVPSHVQVFLVEDLTIVGDLAGRWFPDGLGRYACIFAENGKFNVGGLEDCLDDGAPDAWAIRDVLATHPS